MSVTHWRGSVPHLQPTTKLKPVLFLVGLILLITAGMMLLPMSVDLYYGSEDWRAFAASCALSAVIGSFLTYTSRKSPNTGLTLRQAFVLTPLTWLSVAMISAMPFSSPNTAASAATFPMPSSRRCQALPRPASFPVFMTTVYWTMRSSARSWHSSRYSSCASLYLRYCLWPSGSTF